jgi:hypothetical protein
MVELGFFFNFFTDIMNETEYSRCCECRLIISARPRANPEINLKKKMSKQKTGIKCQSQ